MGLLKGGINEVIATTAFNAAPIGMHYRDGNASMVLFNGSHTAANVERDGWVVANFIHDPVIYVKTAFEDPPRGDYIEETVRGVAMQRLRGADAWAAYFTTIEKKTSGTIRVRLTLETEIIENLAVYPVNRGFGNIIDATVHATRFQITHDPELRKKIDYHTGIVRKCGGKRELEALDLLLTYV